MSTPRPTQQAATVRQALQVALLALSTLIHATFTRPARRRAVTEARVRLGAAAAAHLRDRSAPSFLTRALANREAAAARLAELDRRVLVAAGPYGSAGTIGRGRPIGATLMTPVIALRRGLLQRRLRAADHELGVYARGLDGTRGYLGTAQQAVLRAEAELLRLDEQRAAAWRVIRTHLKLAVRLATRGLRTLSRRLTGRSPRLTGPIGVVPPVGPPQGGAPRTGEFQAIRPRRRRRERRPELAALASSTVVAREAAHEAAQVAKVAITSLAEPPSRQREGFMRFVRPVAGAIALACVLGVMIAVPVGAVVTNRVSAAEASLPDLSQLEELRRPERSEVFDRKGNRIAVLRDEQDRVVLKLDEIPAVMQRAVIAAEDERFYEHRGVDDRGIMRAAVANLLRGDITQGGSTITQQVIRNSYPDLKDTSIDRKIKEAALAAQLETKATKRQILEDYLNLVYFGSGYYGVEAASQGYFGKSVKKIQLHEAALLAAIIRSPEGRNPRSRSRTIQARVKGVRDAVIDRMVRLGMAGPEVAERAKAAPIRVKPPRNLRGQYPFFVDYLIQRLLGDPPSKKLSKAESDRTGDRRLGRTYAERKRNLFEGGLQIRTTLDPDMQKHAEAAVKAVVPKKARADAGLVAIDPRTGAVRAMVGGKDYKAAKFNFAWQARRSPGSSFKTFVLASALENGISPDSVWESSGLPEGSTVCGIPWSPQNYEGGGSGPMTVREATARSVNGVYARLMGELCPEKVARMAERLGVTIPKRDWHAPSIALGGTSVRVIDMATAYATLANGGVYHRPVVVSEVVKRSTGKVLWREKPKGERRISAALAWEVTNTLKSVIQGGTAAGNGQIGRPAAGKTGTSQDYGDAWFVGYTPQLSTAVWIGDPNSNARFELNGDNSVTGGSFPTMIWANFMRKALAGEPALDFARPNERLRYRIVAPPTTVGDDEDGDEDDEGRGGRQQPGVQRPGQNQGTTPLPGPGRGRGGNGGRGGGRG